MDTVLHIVHGGLITSFISNDVAVIAIGGVVGALPDIIGFAEKIIKHDKNAWNWYNKVHSLKWRNIFVYIPQTLIHILQDAPLHTNNCKWWLKPCRKWWVLSWVITLIILYIKII